MARLIIGSFASLVCSILLLPAFVAAAAMRGFVSGVRGIAGLLEPRFVPWTDLIAFDPDLGWRPRASLDAYYLADRDDVYRIVTDEEGWPGRRRLDDSAVVAIGDSFVFGYGVDTGRSFAELNPAFSVKGVGAPGYSMVQSVLLMEQLAGRLAGKLIVWFICLENDLEDNFSPALRHYRAPCVRPSRAASRWELVGSHVGQNRWTAALKRQPRILPQLCVPGPVADRAYDACDYLIGRGAAACRAAGARLTLVTVPDPSQITPAGLERLRAMSGAPASCDPRLPDLRLGESCARHGIRLTSGMDYLSGRDYKRIENLHWNDRGHRRIADLLRQLYAAFRSGDLDAAPLTRQSVGADRVPALQRFPVGSRT